MPLKAIKPEKDLFLDKYPETGKTTFEKIQHTLSDELVIAICSPIGSLRKPVITALEQNIKSYGYDYETIKLSDFITEYYPLPTEAKSGETSYYTQLMGKIEGGNALREKYGPSVLVDLAITEIYNSRLLFSRISLKDELDPKKLQNRKKCYLIDSLKNIEELKVLRLVYRDTFYLFSIFSPKEEREENLNMESKLAPDEIMKIISTDDFDKLLHGQNVRDTFVEGDFFVRVSNDNLEQIDDKVKRYLNLIFNSDIITPYKDEIAMYTAKSASSNSGCLSRQVGAAITEKKGIVISKGWNDVPKYGGNLYRDDDQSDHRCKNKDGCKNHYKKDNLVNEIINKIKSDKELSDKLFSKEGQDEELIKKIEDFLKQSEIKDLIEYSRAVHAEMHAIILGSQYTGDKMINGKLFCTTYPCHHCARHIILAGIKNIFYIEPYIKSLSLELHEDALTEYESDSDEKVKILVYDGVAPRRYLDFFSISDTPRKTKTGERIKRNLKQCTPRNRITLQALPTLEEQAIHSLTEVGFFTDHEV